MFEQNYLDLGLKILREGEIVKGRNGITKQLFGEFIEFDLQKEFPILTTRKSFYKGVLGEFAALMNAPFDNVQHMKDFGVNYWDLWADQETGRLKVDYGNEGARVLNEQGDTQMSIIIDQLKNDPHSRRIILNYWNAENVANTKDPLSLPCCWYGLQFHVRNNKYLDVKWEQRSCDWAIGIQADAILAAAFLIVLANQVGLVPGRCKMSLGNVHLYEEHWESFYEQTTRSPLKTPEWELTAEPGMDYKAFRPDMLVLNGYQHLEPIKYLLKA